MRFILLSGLAGLAVAAPRPQAIDLDAVNAAPDPVLVAAPLDTPKNTPAPVPTKPIDPITSLDPGAAKMKRDGSCAALAAGAGPIPTPDTAPAFLADPDLQDLSTNAPTPDGYANVFTDLQASLSASMYMGLTTLQSYDTLTCASLCDQASGCNAFNVFIERDPSEDPNAENCPNPPSTTNFVCTLWGAPVASSEATNTGQYRDSFQIVITGSNAYNKNTPPPAISGFTGPTELGGAINAPLDAQGHDTYMGFQFFPFSQSQGYTPQTCADACNIQTQYDSQHPAADGSYETCVFFNSYVLSEDAVPQGLYCTFYTATWDRSYGNNYGQYRGSDRYTVSESYSYTLSD